MPVSDPYSARLDRIENKIDQLAEAVISIARAEEQMNSLQKEFDRLYRDNKVFEERLATLSKAVDDNTRTTNWINRVGYGIAAAVGALIVGEAWMFMA